MNRFNLKAEYTLVAIIDVATGETGFTLEDLPLDPNGGATATVDGYTIAHDLLDHVTSFENMGSINDEVIAFGAMWFIRGEYGEIRKGNFMHSNDSMVAIDISRQAIDVLHNQSENFNHVVEFSEDDYIFESVLDVALTKFMEELEHHDDDEVEQDDIDAYFLNVRHLLQQGYNLAQERYNNDWIQVNNLFWEIAETLNNYRGFTSPEYVGQRLTLSIDEFGDVSVDEEYEEEWDEEYEEEWDEEYEEEWDEEYEEEWDEEEWDEAA